MPPRTYRDLTPEELAELEAEFTPRAAVPRLPAAALARSSAPSGDEDWMDAIDPATPATARSRIMLPETTITAGDGDKEAWIDELIGNPPSTPPRAMIRASGAGGDFTGEDTPESRALIQKRGLQVTDQTPPSDADLLDPSISQHQATMPELGNQQSWLDDLIASEGAQMDREQAARSAPPRRSREDIVRETLQPPTRAQGWMAALGDALFGGDLVDKVNARGNAYQGALAQARVQDVAAGEHADDQAAERQLMDARMGLTARGQDLASLRAEQAAAERRALAEQADKRIREEGQLNREAANARTDKLVGARVGQQQPADQQASRLAGVFSQQANVPRTVAQDFLAGKTDGIDPAALERLQNTDDAWNMLSPQKQQESLRGLFGREGATPDQVGAAIAKKKLDPEKRSEIKTSIDEIGRTIAAAADAWAQMTPTARKAFAQLVPEGNFASAVRQGLMTEKDQRLAARVQALANGLVKSRAGSAVTANEWKRVAGEIGFAQNDWSLFNSPTIIEDWIKRSKAGLVGRMKAYESEYQTDDGKGLFDAP